ncbi:DinB family protein [Pedobacter duraquae]|uniref:DinB family protein n=1 Tax=Pedobacter duraquae TaxID=425511 RepID=A0A4R6IGI7_9SPHI|nr:DinB family protein [Pedobacter duraquae]TDO20797.1 DinB family protein [Pedobacter duraquae]
MELNKEVAKHLREVHFGENWTDVNLKDALTGVTWEDANIKIYDLNTIASLVFHINYYVAAVLKVMQGEPLNASDQFSFDHSPIENEEDWQRLIDKVLVEADQLAVEIEKLDGDKFAEDFSDPKYGSYYRNLHGIIEHTHYHLGQISLLKKLINNKNSY